MRPDDKLVEQLKLKHAELFIKCFEEDLKYLEGSHQAFINSLFLAYIKAIDQCMRPGSTFNTEFSNYVNFQ